jgi:Family of unknown function (DUF6526)
MPEAPQSYAHHVRRDPLFHFFVLPVFFIALIASVVHIFRGRHPIHGVVVAIFLIACLVAVFKIRIYPLRVQDRVIRLEERLRLAMVLAEPLRSRIPELTEKQLIALRFASDAELPGLAQRALNEKLSPDDIKKSIQNWRPDNWRI